MSNYTTAAQAAMDRDARNMALAGVPLSGELESIRTLLTSGAVGITADARDVSAVALPGVVARRDKDTAPGTTLLYAWSAFRLHNGKAHVLVPAGTLTLAASAANYVEVSRAGTVSSNTTGFTGGRMALWVVVTGAAGYSDANVTGYATPYTLIGSNGVDGSMLSTPGQTKEEGAQLGLLATAAGASAWCLVVPTTVAAGSKLTRVRFVSRDLLAVSDTNYVSFGLVNKGAAGAGTQALVDGTSAANTSKVTGGSALAAYVPRDLTLATLTAGTERDVTGGDVLELTLTVTGTLANTLRQCAALLEFSFVN